MAAFPLGRNSLRMLVSCVTVAMATAHVASPRVSRSRVCQVARSGAVATANSAETGDADSMDPQLLHLGRRTLGVDYGFRRTGVALSSGYSPQPIAVLESDSNSTSAQEALVAQLMELARRNACEQLVVGMPLDQQGGEGNDQSVATRGFATMLACGAARWRMRTYLWDERGSTIEARLRTKKAISKRYRNLERVDALAAAVILEAFFEMDGRGAEMIDVEMPADRAGTSPVPSSVPGSAGSAGPTAATPPVSPYAEWQRKARERARQQRDSSP